MPLRDHFRTTSTLLNYRALHGGWPMIMAQRLNAVLPDEFVAQPQVVLNGGAMEIDLVALEREALESGSLAVATSAWAAAAPAILIDTELEEPAAYEVKIFTQDEFRLVAAVELVSPSNKDRPENRRTFVAKCETLLKAGVCVTIVDPVTDRKANLYGELIEEFRATRTAVSRADLYAVTCLGRRVGPRWRLESWEHELTIGSALPTLPIWLTPDLQVPLELEATYEEACRSLRIR